MRGHQRLAVRRQLPHQTDAHARGLLGVVFETVVPVRVVEPDLEHEVAGEGQPVAAGLEAHHAVPGRVAAGALGAHARRHLDLLPERPQLVAIIVHELLGRAPQRVRESLRHHGAGEIGRFPEFELGGRDVNPQVRTQPLLHPVDRAARRCGPCACGSAPRR